MATPVQHACTQKKTPASAAGRLPEGRKYTPATSNLPPSLPKPRFSLRLPRRNARPAGEAG